VTSPRTCSLCPRPYKARGLCTLHYQRLKNNGTTDDPEPQQRGSKPPRLCSLPDCDRKHKAQGYCTTHVARFYRYGDALAGGQTRERKTLEPRDRVAMSTRGRPRNRKYRGPELPTERVEDLRARGFYV
jgi:hypothetical protein